MRKLVALMVFIVSSLGVHAENFDKSSGMSNHYYYSDDEPYERFEDTPDLWKVPVPKDILWGFGIDYGNYIPTSSVPGSHLAWVQGNYISVYTEFYISPILKVQARVPAYWTEVSNYFALESGLCSIFSYGFEGAVVIAPEFGNTTPYAGLGYGRYIHSVLLTMDAEYETWEKSKNGYTVMLGIEYYVKPQFFAKVEVRYLYSRANIYSELFESSAKGDLGGIMLGVSSGMSF